MIPISMISCNLYNDFARYTYYMYLPGKIQFVEISYSNSKKKQINILLTFVTHDANISSFNDKKYNRYIFCRPNFIKQTLITNYHSHVPSMTQSHQTHNVHNYYLPNRKLI